MAEVIGIVASGISIAQLAGQVTACTIKLKTYWDEIKDAPTEIKFMVREIDALSLILGQIHEEHEEGVTQNACLQQSLELCRDGAKELMELAKEMEKKMEVEKKWKKRIGATKVVLKKEDIKRLKQRLKSAIRLLGLAHQSYIGTMIRMQPEIIITRMQTLNQTQLLVQTSTKTSNENQETRNNEPQIASPSIVVSKQYRYWSSSKPWLRSLIGSIQYRTNERKERGKRREESSIRYQLPDWLAYRAWEFGAYQDRSAWRLKLQTYRIIPDEHPIFESIHRGDIQGLRRLLSTREAYVNDRDDNGCTTLHLAARYGDPEVCELLLNEGADILSYDDYGFTPFHSALRVQRERPQIQTLLDAGSDELLIQDYECLTMCEASTDTLSFLLQQCFPPFNQWSPHAYYSLATNIPILGIETLHLILNAAKLEEIVRARQPNDRSLLFRCAANYKGLYGSGDKDFSTFINTDNAWRKLTRDLIIAGEDCSALNENGLTPFSAILHCHCDLSYDQLDLRLKAWLWDLKEAGVDLESYGETEAAMDRSLQWLEHTEFHMLQMRISTYGPNVKDWSYWQYEKPNSYAGIFWELVERQTELQQYYSRLNIPGSWESFDGSCYLGIETDLKYDDEFDKKYGMDARGYFAKIRKRTKSNIDTKISWSYFPV